MKKGLLSLLALALTVVGCQNYDDQFDELTSQITSLQSTVDGLTGVSTALSTLQGTVAGIVQSIASLPTTDSVADLSGLVAQLNTISQTLADLEASLADVVTAEDLATISNTLGNVESDVHELLTGSSAISQDIIITTVAELEYAETVIETGENSPSGYVVTGNVTVDLTNLGDESDRVDALTAKLITVIGNVDVIGAVDLATLAYIQGNYTVGSTDASEPLLRNVTGNVTLDGAAGNINYSDLATIGGNVSISNTISVTRLDFSGANIGGSLNSGVIVLANASSVDVGGATITELTANNADSITLGQTAIASTTVVNATKDGSAINFSATGATAALTVVGTSTTVIRADALASAATVTVEDSSESHFGALASASGPLTITAGDAADFRALTDLAADASIGGTAVNLDALSSTTTGTLTLPNEVTVSLPLLDNSQTLSVPAATSLTLKSSSRANLDADLAATIALTEQDEDFTITASTELPALTDLTVTGKQLTVATNIAVAITSNTTLTNVTVGGFAKSLWVTSTGDLDSVTTSGRLSYLSLDASDLDALSLGHTYISGDIAPEIFITNSDLTSINLSSIAKVKTIDIQGNAALKTVTPPSTAEFAEPAAPITVVLGTNSLTAVYTDGVAAVAPTQTTSGTDAVEPIIASTNVRGLLDWVLAATANTTAATSTSIDVEYVTYGSNLGSLAAAIAADANSGVATSPIATKPTFDLVVNN